MSRVRLSWWCVLLIGASSVSELAACEVPTLERPSRDDPEVSAGKASTRSPVGAQQRGGGGLVGAAGADGVAGNGGGAAGEAGGGASGGNP